MNLELTDLLGTAAICMILSLILAWLGSMIIYAKIKFLKRLFPATHNLIRAHIDYLMMTGLLVITYFLMVHLQINLPDFVILALCVGALYNPFGFIVIAVKPKMANPETLSEKALILTGFIPATLGFGYSMILVIVTVF